MLRKPAIKILRVSKDAAFGAAEVMNGHPMIDVPALYCAHPSIKVGSNGLPGIKTAVRH